MKVAMRSLFLALTLLSSASIAQPQAETTMPLSRAEALLPGNPQDSSYMQRQAVMPSGGMDGAMMRMADMCEQMMKRSMAVMPYALAAGIGLGILLTLALLLLIVLEVQWIIFWRRRLKAQR
ncbi:MAG: hypothetical protein PSX71_03580 [bacterium]|nr:hypothetical protein [bacterium]